MSIAAYAHSILVSKLRTPVKSTCGQRVPGCSSCRRRSRTSLHVVAAGGPSGGISKKLKSPRGSEVDTPGKKLLVGVAVSWVTLVLLLPTANVFVQAFSHGVGPFLHQMTDPDFLNALKLTLSLAAVAVPINTLFGISVALLIARNEFRGKTFLMAILDLPFSISPVVTGLMLVLLYGRNGWFAPALNAMGFNVVFAFPGMALATLFVTMPFVARELIPILESMDMAQEEAARTLGASDIEVFWHVTLPNIRWGLMYGIILTNARAMGEFGAVSVISGNIIGRTQTLTLYVEGAYKEYNTEAAFSASVLLSMLAVLTLGVKEVIERLSSRETAK